MTSPDGPDLSLADLLRAAATAPLALIMPLRDTPLVARLDQVAATVAAAVRLYTGEQVPCYHDASALTVHLQDNPASTVVWRTDARHGAATAAEITAVVRAIHTYGGHVLMVAPPGGSADCLYSADLSVTLVPTEGDALDAGSAWTLRVDKSRTGPAGDRIPLPIGGLDQLSALIEPARQTARRLLAGGWAGTLDDLAAIATSLTDQTTPTAPAAGH